ncbi:MAG: bifunctional 3-(3-hydroxy-phenyl)propionate/3-hydroxycinnamic acid hydroxylase [Proteobacteria bacterium]|nr:bifunctional 3-(3-hydroxy-phenyl)propionate/3-hydroxycinnamic acid hydroxylase [Pseudomonadota bacterium]
MKTDVLVVGGGPTGITLGLLLARAGVRTLVIDKEADIYPLPRAAHIDHEIVRIFQELGIAESVMATSRRSSRYDFLTAGGEVLMRFEGMDRIGPGGWPAGNMIHQPSIEAALREGGRKLDTLDLRTGWTWTGCREDAAGTVSTVTTPDGETEILARYIVGADGARSPVRNAAGIEFDDLQFDEPWLVIDTIVHDPERLPKINLQICDPARPTTCVLMGEGRHRWEFMLKPGESAEQVLDDAFIAALLKPWNVDGAITLERKAVYRFNAKVATQWRKGRLLLAGDAAHQMPPFAGQGLCTGLRDAANLAWKLAAVLRGADDRLLDTYQQERDPHVRPIIAMAMMMGRTVCITDPAAAKARDEQMLAARGQPPAGGLGHQPFSAGCLVEGSAGAGSYFPQTLASEQKLDDELGTGPWLIARSKTLPSNSDVKIARTTTLGEFGAPLEAWLEKHDAEAVLVRPDRYVFGTGAPDALLRAWSDWIAPKSQPTIGP